MPYSHDARADACLPAARPQMLPVTDAQIRDAVRFAWAAVRGRKSFLYNLPWGKSQPVMQGAVAFCLFIEHKLGVVLPVDAMAADTTPSQAMQMIADWVRGSEPRDVKPDERPPVHLLPAIQGDDPALAQFRHGLQAHLRVQTLGYPGWSTMVGQAQHINLVNLVDRLYAELRQQPPSAPYHLIGYSFGGIVAFELAKRLHAAGLEVGLLCLIDTRRWDLIPADPNRKFHTFLGEPRSRLLDAPKQLIGMLVRQQRYTALQCIEDVVMSGPSKPAFWLKRQINKETRAAMLRHWQPERLDVPVLHFLSHDVWPGEPDDNRWNEICPQRTVIRLDCNHEHVFAPPQCQQLQQTIFAALKRQPAALTS